MNLETRQRTTTTDHSNEKWYSL